MADLWIPAFAGTTFIGYIQLAKLIKKPYTGDFDDQIIPQSPDFFASFTVYITLSRMINKDAFKRVRTEFFWRRIVRFPVSRNVELATHIGEAHSRPLNALYCRGKQLSIIAKKTRMLRNPLK